MIYLLGMNALHRSRTQRALHILKIVLIAIFGLAGVATVVLLMRSGVLPLLYISGVAVLWLVAFLVAGWLLLGRFRRFETLARVIGATLVIAGLTAATLGLFVLHNALGVLDDISKGGSVTIRADEPFYVFISGIDTYGDIASQSRSDVNILAGINPRTHTITLVTVPRDAYLPIALGGNDQYDKLTHAGNYGVESSMKTVANLFDVTVDAYVRINFTSFIQGIDKLGGITVHNPAAFTSSNEHFPAGDIYLTGERALIYSRERKSLSGGDIDRGKNQQRVITGIVSKASSVRSLDGLQSLLEIGRDSVQTNVAGEALRQLIYGQVRQPAEWRTESLQVTGRGETGTRPSYAMPDAQLYMYILDDSSVEEVKARLQEAMSAS